MPRDKHYYNYIIDIIEKIERIKEKVKVEDFDNFIENNDLQEILEYNLMIIGEAVSKIPIEVLKKYNSDDFYWRQIKDMRNYLIHQYWGVSLEMVWEVATKDILELELYCKEMLTKEIILKVKQ
jgi:uncharacterized protein with HEPN domain